MPNRVKPVTWKTRLNQILTRNGLMLVLHCMFSIAVYLTRKKYVRYGGLEMKQWQISLTFLVFLFFPPIWLLFSFPLPHRVSELPFLKLVVHVTSHLYFIIIMILVFMTPFQPLYQRQSLFPTPEEWLLLFWLFGNLLAELMSHEERRGMGMMRAIVLFLAACAVALHIAAASVADADTVLILMYLRCQLLAGACFFADIQILSYLSFHQLFGPFGIMLGDIVVDLMRFLVIFSVFLVGFTFSLSALYEDTTPNNETYAAFSYIMPMKLDPWASVQLNYWAIFGLYDPWQQVPAPTFGPSFAQSLIWLLYGVYLTATMIVLMNLLIAMLSDTYQRIKARSDLEWKFIRAKIIINLEKTPISPPPINLFTVLLSYVIKTVSMILERNAARRVRDSSEKLVPKDYTKALRIRRWRKSVISDMKGSTTGTAPLLNSSPAQKLTEVVAWSEVVTVYEGLDDAGSFDSYD